MALLTHFEVLGLPQTADTAAIQARYTELARRFHADPAPTAEALRDFKRILEAYEVLSDPEQRTRYVAGLTADGTELPVSTPPAPAGIERTEAFPLPNPTASVPPERTTAFPAPSAKSPAPIREESSPVITASKPIEDAEEKRLAAELAKRGVPRDEIERLIALNRSQVTGVKPPAQKTTAPSPIDDLPPSTAYVPKPTITLPPPRAVTPAQRMEADRLLTATNIARRRGNYADAERNCRQAVEQTPGDAAALELYGDILQSTGRVDDALYAYQRAIDIGKEAADASGIRTTAEKKYAELMLMQNREIDLLRVEYVERNPNIAVFLSALTPGAGHLYLGALLKGLLLLGVEALLVFLIVTSSFTLSGKRTDIPPSLIVKVLLAVAVYIYALVDANRLARSDVPAKSGWDV